MAVLALHLLAFGVTILPAPVARAQSALVSITLKPNPSSKDRAITLGDVFFGVPAGKSAIVIGTRNGPTAFLDAGQVQVLAAREGLNWANPSGLSRISVQGGDLDATAPAPRHDPLAAQARIQSPSQASVGRDKNRSRPGAGSNQVLIYARNINAGELIAAEDLTWSANDVVRPAGAVRSPEEVIGFTAKYALRSGQAVEGRQISPPKVVRKNDMIYVDWSEGGVTLSLQARALDDGAVGQTIQVLNTQSKKTIEAVVAGPGRAVTGQAAESLKRSHPNSSR